MILIHQIRLRQSQAGNLFLGVYENSKSTSRTLIGFVCSTLSPAESLTHESMSTHVPNSSTVCIHSVCVAKAHQRKGIGLALLKEYIHRLESRNTDGVKYQRVLLITHEELRPFYESAGFEWVGPSNVVHGSRPWFEMRRNLKFPSRTDSPKTETPERMIQHVSMPSNILEALRQPKDKVLAGKLISDFHHGLSDLLELDESRPGTSGNKYNLVCSRAECGSLVLKKGVAKWVERGSVQASNCSTHCYVRCAHLMFLA
jgi:GNAT superfamily N-acetyltransferase